MVVTKFGFNECDTQREIIIQIKKESKNVNIIHSSVPTPS